MNPKNRSLIEKLTQLTLSGKLSWQETSSMNEYIMELDSASFMISQENNRSISLEMLNNGDNRRLLAKENPESFDFYVLNDLFNAIQTSITRDAIILSNVMVELAKIESK